MKKQYFFVANWKMNMSFDNATDFATTHYEDILSLCRQTKQKIIICPSFTAIQTLTNIFQQTEISIGAQDCSSHLRGSFTGQISAQDLHSIGCSHTIIGHSESRKSQQDTNEMIAQKCVHLLSYSISPIICIGESKKEYNEKRTLKVLEQQLQPIINTICGKTTIPTDLPIYIAYEPIWAIGTGKIAQPEHLEMIATWISIFLKKACPSIKFHILYGGSVSSKTANRMAGIENLDGFLIGKASLSFQELKKIVQSILVT